MPTAPPGGTRRQDTTEQKLRDAIHTAAGLTAADRWVFDTLLWMADFGTAHLPDRFAPRSLKELAAKSFVSQRQVKYSLDHLQRHGWVERYRHFTDEGIGGRGHPTRYVLKAGISCDCPKGKGGTRCPVPEPKEGNGCTGKGAGVDPVSAGQAPDSAGKARGRGSKGWDGKPEYKGGPVSWEPEVENLDDFLNGSDR